MANRVQLLVSCLILMSRFSLATGTNEGVPLPPGQPLAWLRTSADKTHFVGDGTDNSFLPWGFNYDHDEAGRLLEDYWADDWSKVAVDFHKMKDLGANVVRIHLQLCRFMKSSEEPDGKNLARLGQLVQLAEATGVYLDVTGLGCYHKDEVPAWYDAMAESARWKIQARFWRAVAGVCKDSPAIFCYDLMNEPVSSGDGKDDWLPGEPLGGSYFVQRLTTDMRGRTDVEIAKEWIAGMSAAIRTVDQRHMITVGISPWEEPFGPGAKSAFRDPDASAPLDFLSVHYYPRAGKLDDDLDILKLYDIGKPLVIEEIFPLQADVGTTGEFIRKSKTAANGWISFYWGTTGEYEKEPGIKAALTGGWLRHFSALRGEMVGAAGTPAPTTLSPPPPLSDTLVWFFRQKIWLGAAALLYTLYIGYATISSAKSRKVKTLLRQILSALVVLIGVLLVFAGFMIHNANFHAIVNGEAYRSGQMDAAQLSRVIQEYSIKSIINLRGTNAPALYQGEMETARRLGVQHYDFSLSANDEIALSQMDEIIRTLRVAPKPVLIHCKAGSDRTGLVSALYCLTLKGETPAQAERELSVWYGHVPQSPLANTIAMDHSYWHYVSNYLARADQNLQPASVSR